MVEVQKGLSRIQRIRNKLRDFGKKKRTEKKERKHSLIDESIVDVEMIEIESNGKWIMVFMTSWPGT